MFRTEPSPTRWANLKLRNLLHSEGVVTVDSAHVPHYNPVIVSAGCDTGNKHVNAILSPNRLFVNKKMVIYNSGY